MIIANINIPIKPVSKKNHMIITKYGKLVQSKAYREYEKACEPYLKDYKGLNIDEPVNVMVCYYLPLNKDGSTPKTKADLCNFLGATCDILVHYGVLKDDNCQIVTGHDGSRIYYVSNPECIGVDIIIESIGIS